MKQFYQLFSILNKIPQRHKLRSVLVLLSGILSSSLFSQQTYTFTNAGQTGSVGPTALHTATAYASTNLAGNVAILGQGVQSWTVPTTGGYGIRAIGASGGTPTTACITPGGRGANMYGEFNLTAGQVLRILVGQEGSPSGSSEDGGGGGGSYVTTSASVALIVAGGGGGSTNGTVGTSCVASFGLNASLTTTATNGANGLGVGGVNGTGGAGTGGGAGGGFTTNGTGGNTNLAGGLAFMNGGTGGYYQTAGPGGYGGGGSGYWEGGNGGGGGGYSGGGTNSASNPYTAGGGGGSYNSGANQSNAVMTVSGHGRVIITELCAITLTANGVNSNSAICSGASVTLTTNGISNYVWSTGITGTNAIIVSPTSTTIYTLSATSPSNCTAVSFYTVIVDPSAPSLTVANTASATSGICPSKTVALTASGATTYTWTGGSTTVTNGVVFTPTTSWTYSVSGTNACGTTSAMTSVSIHPVPSVTAVASTQSLCSGTNLTLTGLSNPPSTYAWSGGPLPITNGVGFQPSSTVNYSVIATSPLTCTNIATTSVVVVTTPILAPTASPTVICIGGTGTLTASGAANYTWTSPSATVFTNTFVIPATTPAGAITYTVTKSNSNCVDTKMITVSVLSLTPVLAIVNPGTVCASTQATLFAGGGITYTWTAPGPPTFTFTGASPVVSPPVTSIYTVTAHDGTCVNTTTVQLVTKPNPTITITPSTPSVCAGGSVGLTANGGVNYTWTSVTATLNTPIITDTPTASIVYNVVGDNTVNCTAGNSQIILVYPNPTLTAVTNKTLVCKGGPSTMTAGGAHTYSWDPGAGSVLTATALVNPLVTTMYTVTGSYTTTCFSEKTISVTVFSPTMTVTQPTNTCDGGTMTLTASGANAGSYNWNTGGGFTNQFQTIVVKPTALTVYSVSALSSSNAVTCPLTQTTSVGIFYNPTITAVAEKTTICKGGETGNLIASGGVNYSWSNAMTGTTITVGPYSSPTTVNFTVTGTDANNCSNTGTVVLKVSGCTGLADITGSENNLLVYPNPNNGEFIIHGQEEINLTLVNELGQIVRTISLTHTNNYEASVKDLTKGVYFVTGLKDNLQIHQKVIVTK